MRQFEKKRKKGKLQSVQNTKKERKKERESV